MSEVQSRPSAPRGRGSARGGRGGFSSRGGRGSRVHGANGDRAEAPAQAAIEDDSEVGQLKKEFGNNFAVVKDIYPDWTDEDIVFALQETNNDLDGTVAGIADGELPTFPRPGLSTPFLKLSTNPCARYNCQMGCSAQQEGQDPRKGPRRYRLYHPRRAVEFQPWSSRRKRWL